MTEVETDEQLMVRVSQGDERAFTELYVRYKKKLYNFLYRFSGGNPALTEDLFQETFLRLYKYSPNYKPLAKFSTFLFRIATNLSLNEIKKRNRVHFFSLYKRKNSDDYVGLSLDEDSIPSKGNSPEEEAFGTELDDHFQKALSKIPEKMRITLLLSEFEGKKYEEIAKILGCSVGTVKSRVNRSRSKLRKYFSEYEIL